MLNCIIIMGRLTADPELRTTQSGLSVTSFTVAVDRKFSKQGEEKQTDFINVVAWRNNAEFITRYFGKGQMIALQGSLQTRTYEDKNGNKRTAYEVIADSASFCGGKSENNSADMNNPQFTVLPDTDGMPFSADEDDEGLPF